MNFLLGLLLTAVSLLPLHAQATNGINVQLYNPSTSSRYVMLEDAFPTEWPKQPKYYFGLNYNYDDEPLVATDLQGNKLFNYIDNIQTADAFFGFKLTPKFALFFAIPVHLIRFPDTLPVYQGNTLNTLQTGSASSLGDLKIMGKVRVTEDASSLAVALIPEVHLPTGNTQYFVSDGSAYVAARIALEKKFDTFGLNANFGFASAQNAIYADARSIASGIDYRKRFFFGLGTFIPFNDQWGMSAEYNTIHMIPFDSNLNPNEFYTGIRVAMNENTAATVGASLGKLGGNTGQNYRIIAGLRITLYSEDAKPFMNNMAAPNVNQTYTPAPLAIMTADRIQIFSPIDFELNSDQISASSNAVLNEVADLMKKNLTSFKQVFIDGHTDRTGNDESNLKLSLARSKAVKKALILRGIPANKLLARGFGERKSSQANRARIEFIVIPNRN